jgi:glutaredoxin
VSQDREKVKEMIEKSKQMGVPVIIIGDDVVVGFDQALIDKLLAPQS